MDTAAPNLTPLLLLVAIGLLVWSWRRARARGRVGILNWLQGLAFVLPWGMVFGLSTVGIDIGFAGFVLMMVVATAFYIIVGRQARQAAGRERQRQATRAAFEPESVVVSDANPSESAEVQERAEPSSAPAQPPTIPAADLAAIESIFSIDTYFLTETVPTREGAIFKGNLRTDAAAALEALSEKLRQVVGDRYQLFLIEDLEQKPAAIVLPERNANLSTSTNEKALVVAMLVASCLTLLELGANLNGFSLISDATRWPEALPLVAGVLALLAGREGGLRWMAARYDVRVSPPFVIPSLGIGTLGGLSRYETPLPDRKALFDVALAGPLVSAGLSLVLVLLGLLQSGQPAVANIGLPTSLFQYSVLVGGLARSILGAQMQQEAIAIDPLVAVGWVGLFISALGLLPAGQLDGGRIVQAVYGRAMARRTTFATLGILGIASLANILALYWALVIFTIVRAPERPPRNEITEVDTPRDIYALLALLFAALVLLPIPEAIAVHIGMG
ncbi:MAG: site-2 protease family protein [Cyanobacteria bacterium P01_D01_bin.123]